MIDLFILCADLKNSQSKLRQKSNIIIHDIFHFLKSPSEDTKNIIDGWKEDFSYIYGSVDTNISSNKKIKPAKILKEYNIEFYEDSWSDDTQLLFLSIQTYFSLLIKTMMKYIFNSKISNYEEIILGKFAVDFGIKNYIHRDWYCWPLHELSNGFNTIMKEIDIDLELYKTNTSVLSFVKNNNNDFIKQMYEAIVPRELRHALGEYYTPDWLAERTLLETCELNDLDITKATFIDPTCGSGTFLFKTIALKRSNGVGLQSILKSVYGFDINPLAVLTSKTNYLLSILDLISSENEIIIPIYNIDVLKIGEDKFNNYVDLNIPDAVERIRQISLKEQDSIKELPKFDAVIGNPPWVNWEYMPEQYRTSSQHKWVDYGLFNAKGRDLSFSKEDISVLITYIVMDYLLKDCGILGFVIRQGVFKSAQNGVGFRKFRIKDEKNIKVLRVDDLSKINAFDNASNSTALFYARKDQKTIYPVPYFVWTKREDIKRFSFIDYSSLQEVLSQVYIEEQIATPTVENDESSLWLNSTKEDISAINKVLGTNEYRARTGVFTGGANAVYWLNINSSKGDHIQVENIVDRAKRKVEKVNTVLEKEYVYPMIKGSNLRKWNFSYDTYLLCPHSEETKMWPVSKLDLENKSPLTFEYLSYFKEDLDSRKGFAGWEKEIQKEQFHSILRIGEYTFSKYKVIWKYIATEFVCAVISTVNDEFLGDKMLIPNEKIMYVSFDDEMEAFYLCGMLSSTLVSNCVKSYMNPTSISAHVLNKLSIPTYDCNNIDHVRIAEICKQGSGKTKIDSYISEIDMIVQKIYKIG